jgi:thymidylate synthase (FAD)
MRIVQPAVEVSYAPNYGEALLKLETLARNCYRSEAKMTGKVEDAEKFISMIIKRGHFGVLEHEIITVKLITNRAISLEVVRHRIASYLQVSTRYADMAAHGDIEFILSGEITDPEDIALWAHACETGETVYKKLRERGHQAQIARDVLDHALRTDVNMTANISSWRNVFTKRLAFAAHPDMRRLMADLASQMLAQFPIFFSDVIEPGSCSDCRNLAVVDKYPNAVEEGEKTKKMWCNFYAVDLEPNHWNKPSPCKECLFKPAIDDGSQLPTLDEAISQGCYKNNCTNKTPNRKYREQEHTAMWLEELRDYKRGITDKLVIG